MSQDDLLVRNAIQRMGVNASVEWTRQCIIFKNKQDASTSPATPNQDIAQFIFEMYLLADFRTLEPKPLLPSSIATPHNQSLFTDFGGNSVRLSRSSGGAILQILEIQDIGISSLKMLEACEAIGVTGDQPGGFPIDRTLPKGMLSLDLTDGLRKITALVMEPILGIAMEMKIGAKIRVRDVPVRHGVLQLNPSNTFLLGGEVAKMNQNPRRLVIMNQMKKKLGLPLDVLPVTNPALQLAQQTSAITPTTPTTFTATSGNTSNNSNHNSSSGNNSNFKNVWSNPQAAVRAQDSIPSTTSLNESTWRAPVSTGVTTNPWKSFKPARNSPSPEPEQRLRDEQEDYMRMMEEQQPQWDFHQDMEMDDIGMPYDDADWEVMSHLSMDDVQQDSDRKKKEASPDLVTTKSPVKRSLLGGRSISLKAPHSRQQEKQRADSWEVETSLPMDYKALKTGGSDGGDLEKDRKGSPRDVFSMNKKSSPESDKADIKESMKEVSRSSSPFKLDRSVDSDSLKRKTGLSRNSSPSVASPINYGQDLGNLKRFAEEDQSDESAGNKRGSKRRVSPEYESADQDYTTNRRRSRSFVPFPQIGGEDDTQVKVKMKKDSNLLLNVKKEVSETAHDSYSEMEKIIHGESSDLYNKNIGTSYGTGFSDSEKLSAKVNVEKLEAKGASYNAAIDLLSDDDDDNSRDHKLPIPEQDISDLDIQMKIKSEPGYETSIQKKTIVKTESETTYTQDYNTSESRVYIKQEETLLEFDMDDDCDFGGLTEVIAVIPEVDLDQVQVSVRDGREVKAQARVHKLGKFSLTTLAVSIPIILLPVTLPILGEETVTGDSTPTAATDVQLEAVLDQPVVELLLNCSITQFRELVRINEPEAKKAVGRLRSTLSEVETVECQFKGLRSNIPVIRELEILTKKHR
ncbi:hypothetical protein BGX27_003322 [Mortierella sp. AM989]|nr:hypothetical protein BGX27_003322 [Mortierella sp. AM989]